MNAVVQKVLVEEFTELMALLGLVLCIEHPRGFEQEDVLQLLVLLQFALQSGFLSFLCAPQLDEVLQLRHTLGKALRHSVGIECNRPVDGIIVFWIHNGMKCHHCVPRRIVGVFKHHLALRGSWGIVVEECAQIHLLLTLAFDVERYGFRQVFLAGEDRQPVSFSIGESLVSCRNLTNEHAIIFRNVVVEAHGSGLSCLHIELLRTAPHFLFGFRVEESDDSIAFHCLFTLVDNSRCNAHLVAMAHETRHVRLYHQFLASHNVARHAAIVHVLRVSQSHESPFGQALRKREGNLHFSLCVGLQIWIEERCLVEVLTEWSRMTAFPSLIHARSRQQRVFNNDFFDCCTCYQRTTYGKFFVRCFFILDYISEIRTLSTNRHLSERSTRKYHSTITEITECVLIWVETAEHTAHLSFERRFEVE